MVGVVMALMAAPNSAISNSFCMFIRYLFKARGFGDCECLGPVAYLFFQCAEIVFRCAENVNSSRNDIATGAMSGTFNSKVFHTKNAMLINSGRDRRIRNVLSTGRSCSAALCAMRCAIVDMCSP
jgi:hypothetical protein